MKNYYVVVNASLPGFSRGANYTIKDHRHPEVNNKNLDEFIVSVEDEVKNRLLGARLIDIISWQEVREV